jgi:pentatricopeptide repeat protein
MDRRRGGLLGWSSIPFGTAAQRRIFRSERKGDGLPGDLARWREARAAIRADVLKQGWSEELGAFKQSYEDSWLDAANLRFSALGFLDGDEARMVATIGRTLKGLTDHALCYRYLRAPGSTGKEGTFTVCGFWLVQALLLAGRTDEARHIFEEMLRSASPVGLYAEEIDAVTRLQLGNFPQALSHIGLIAAATSLAHAGRVASEHSEAVAAARSSARVTPPATA